MMSYIVLQVDYLLIISRFESSHVPDICILSPASQQTKDLSHHKINMAHAMSTQKLRISMVQGIFITFETFEGCNPKELP